MPGDHRFAFNTYLRGAIDFFGFILIFNPIVQDPYVTVVATNPGDDQIAGISIINAAEMVAQQVCETFSITLRKTKMDRALCR